MTARARRAARSGAREVPEVQSQPEFFSEKEAAPGTCDFRFDCSIGEKQVPVHALRVAFRHGDDEVWAAV